MLSQSVLGMTIVDLLVIVMTLLTFKFASTGGFFRRWSRGRALSLIGVATLSLFYVADLLVMHVSPAIIGADRANELMDFLHLEVLWLVTVISACLVVIGFQLTNKARLRDEQRLSLMTDALPLAVAYIDVDGRYQFANARYAKLHAKTVRAIVGATVQEVVRPDLAETFREHNQRALQGEAQSYEHHTRLEMDGQMHDMHVDLVPDISADNSVAGFFLLVRDVTTHVQLEREVVRIAEAERLSVARDLHDGLGQSLTGISLALTALARKLGQEGSKEVALVTKLIGTTQNAIEQTRQFTHLLAPTMQGGLFSALRTLAREVGTLYDVECYTRCPPDDINVSPPVAMHLYRIAQESVSNATRHGRACTIRIDCRLNSQALVLTVLDDGLGIPVPRDRQEGIGISSMHYRARMIGGLLRVAGGSDGGTEVSCTVPLTCLGRDEPALHAAEALEPSALEAPAAASRATSHKTVQ
ncbi:MAG TPA: PAS domain-containing protein [Gammaproteobacteria bacterium]|nr:PAS domain-containing protein [Gammaproteobacteria bacterium]